VHATLGAEIVGALIAGDAAQPGSQFGRVGEVAHVPPSGDEGGLRDILGGVEVAAGAVSNGTDEVLVFADDSREGVAVAGDALLN